MSDAGRSDVVYDEVGSQRRLVGVNDFVQSYQAWKRAGPDGKGTVTRALANGDTVLIEVTWTATQTGPIETPKGPIPHRESSGTCAEFR